MSETTTTNETSSELKILPPEEIREWVRTVEDPELFLSIVDLGLVYETIMPEPGKAHVKMTLTSPMCPAGGYLVDQMKKRLLENPAIKEAEVEIVWEPKWDPKTMSTDEVKDSLGIW